MTLVLYGAMIAESGRTRMGSNPRSPRGGRTAGRRDIRGRDPALHVNPAAWSLRVAQGTHFLAQSFHLAEQSGDDAQAGQVHVIVDAQPLNPPQHPNRFEIKPPAIALRQRDGCNEPVAAIHRNLVARRLGDLDDCFERIDVLRLRLKWLQGGRCTLPGSFHGILLNLVQERARGLTTAPAD